MSTLTPPPPTADPPAAAGATPAGSRAHGAGFWAVAYAFLTVMAFSAVPTPLYVLYQQRDGWSSLTITLIFSAYAVGVVLSLFLVGHLSDRHGRRRLVVPAVLLNILAAIIFLTWNELPGLLLGRFVGGLGVGAITATATAWIAELHGAARPGASVRRAQTVATAANIGGIGFGPLVGGILAQWVGGPLVTPYVVFLVALVVALVVVLLTPETRERANPMIPYRPQSVVVPPDSRAAFFAAATSAFIAFAMLGMFTSLAPGFIGGTLGHHSRALAGLAVFIVFAAGATAQSLTGTRSANQVLTTGLAAMVVGPLLLIIAVWLPSPSLAVFLIGGAVSGVGSGLMFKGSVATAASLAAPSQRAEALAGIFLAGYIGITVPVVGLGLLTQELAADVSLTIFGVVLIAGVALAATLMTGSARKTPAAV